jgi:hypothetical protein
MLLRETIQLYIKVHKIRKIFLLVPASVPIQISTRLHASYLKNTQGRNYQFITEYLPVFRKIKF